MPIESALLTYLATLNHDVLWLDYLATSFINICRTAQ